MNILKNNITLRDYQQEVSTEVFNHYGSEQPFVLGACPNSGKTITSIDIIARLLESGKAKRVLVLAHGTKVIRDNFTDECKKLLKEGSYSKDLTKDVPVHVTLPYSYRKIQYDYDVIIVDEAHQFYHADTVQGIKDRVDPKLTLLLTGTPSKFIAQQDQYKIRIIAMNQIDSKHFHNVDFKLVKSDYSFGIENYNANFDITEKSEMEMKNTTNTINNVVYGMVQHIAKKNNISLSNGFNAWEEAKQFLNTDKLGKTLFVCNRIAQATQVANILNDNGITAYVSNSQTDVDSDLITRFKKGEIQILCVVNRCREGFSDENIMNLVDLSMTHNINTISQTYCRAVRKHKTIDNNKLYIKVTPNAQGMPEYTMNVVSAALMLSHYDYLSTFNGRNFNGLIVPKIEVNEEDQGQFTLEARPHDSEEVCYETADGTFIDSKGEVLETNELGFPVNIDGEIVSVATSENKAEDLEELEDEKKGNRKYLDNELRNDIDSSFFLEVAEELSEGNVIYTTTTIDKARATLMGRDKLMSPSETIKVCVENRLTSTPKYESHYKANPSLELPSKPWETLKQSQTQYFDEIKKELGVYVKPKAKWLSEDIIKYCVENELTHSGEYKKHYKANPSLGLPTTPWGKLKQSGTEYFDNIKKELGIYWSNEDVIKYCVENGLSDSGKYERHYKANPSLELPTSPWSKLKQNIREYFDEIKKELGIYWSNEDVIKYCVENGLTGRDKYGRHREANPSLGLPSNPWAASKQSKPEYFAHIKQTLEK